MTATVDKPEAKRHPLVAKLMDWWRRFSQQTVFGFVLWRVAVRYGEDYVSIRAGMLSYFVFFSLFPLLLLLISLVGFFFEPAQAQHLIYGLLKGFPQVMRELIQTNVNSAYLARGPVSLIGLGTLAWSTMQVYFALTYALNYIWATKEERAWYWLYVQALGVIGLGIVLVLVTIAAETFWQTFGTVAQPFMQPGEYEGLLKLSALALSLTGSFGFFLAIYRFVPSLKVGWRYLWPGALVGTLLWKLSQSAFAWYLKTLSRNEVVYGSIGVIISLMLWLYVTALIILIGAEVNRALADWNGLWLASLAKNAAVVSEGTTEEAAAGALEGVLQGPSQDTQAQARQAQDAAPPLSPEPSPERPQ
ncbi:MAG: YihY/virulence factor BrkB family protein [Candidatus Sericytochromatia bacterium]|nr:YihY/virulence factor BrkB family protein [Candidatus Sericytochromatia bacterium]